MITKTDFYIDTIQGNRINYVVQTPNDYDSSKKYPLIVFTHGDGSKANTGINRMFSEGLCGNIYRGLNIPFIVVSPQTPYANFDVVGDNNQYKPGYFVNEMAQIAIKRYSIDIKRIYLTGLSMSGSSVDLGLAYYPNTFAAGVNVSSWPPDFKEAEKIKGAIWHIKGNADRQGGAPEGNIAFIEKVRGYKQSPDARYTIFNQPGHYAWEATYTNTTVPLDPKYPGSTKQENIFDWFLKFSLDNVVEPPVEPPTDPEEPETPEQPPVQNTETMTIKDSTGRVLLGKTLAINYFNTNKTGNFTEASSEGEKNIGWIRPQDYFHYTLQIPLEGVYNFDMRVAAVKDTTIQLKIGNNAVMFPVKSTGGWQNWQTVTVQLPLTAGLQTLSVVAINDGWNFHHFVVNPYSLKVGGYLISE